MTWLARLKKSDDVAGADATETTKRVSVVSVAPVPGPLPNTRAGIGAANDPAPDPDRWSWPQSRAMNGVEIDTFTARLARLTDKGLSLQAAEGSADTLALRDRQADDRRLRLECAHLAGHAAGAWRCMNWQQAGIATRAKDARLPGELVLQLQRCDGFNDQQHQRDNDGNDQQD